MRVYVQVSIVLTLVMLFTGAAMGECMLANPSFELGGSGGEIFGGWNQFGSVGSTTDATHGFDAARVTGPDIGDWGTSGFWQSQDTAPGERWAAYVKGWHTAVNPLTGTSRAMLNIEWRDASDGLISYESHTVADAATPVGEIQEFYVESGPAPSGTVTTHLLLGVLQGAGQPAPDVFYDEARFENLGPPTLDDVQWNDFPGGRTVGFGGFTWRVKGPGWYGPGPSLFCDNSGCVWVDVEDRLHMTIQNISGSWYSTEVTLEEVLGYGDYIFTTVGRLDELDPRAVLGLFLWEYGPCYDAGRMWWNPYNEIDVEISRWGDPGNDVGQFVAQPWDYPGNMSRFDATFGEDEITSHAFRWLPDAVEYRSWRGGPLDEGLGSMIHTWTYTGPHIPRPDRPRVHINLWQFGGAPGSNQEVILDEFTFVPQGVAAVSIPDASVFERSHLKVARPNPFSDQTTIGYNMKKGGDTEVVVYDVLGRRIRGLVRGFVHAGDHEVVWNGCDDSGERVASGAYVYQLRTDDVVETRKFVLLE